MRVLTREKIGEVILIKGMFVKRNNGKGRPKKRRDVIKEVNECKLGECGGSR